VLLDSGANAVIEQRFQNVEIRKKKIVAGYDKKKDAVQRTRDAKIQKLEAQLSTFKEDKRLAREGYVRSAIDQRIQSLTVQLAHLPEHAELQQLQADCERDCALLDEGLFEEDEKNTSEEESSEFSSDDESPEAARWRERLRRRYGCFSLYYIIYMIAFIAAHDFGHVFSLSNSTLVMRRSATETNCA
jgi:hypothetical protein